MSPAEMCWMAARHPREVLDAVEERLVEAGAVIELRQFHGLGADEIDCLLRQEREDAA